jgi:SAM-dependent methyltransferase
MLENFNCRICKNKGTTVIDLGYQPLANAIVKNKKDKEKKYPLKIFKCKSCHTLQLTRSINPKILFSNYVWVTGTSKSTVEYLKNFSKYITHKLKLTKNSKILEIASNDGTLLKILKKKYKNIFGIEPAKNLAYLANKKGLNTLNYFFNFENSNKIKKRIGSKVDLIICRNVIPHMRNLHSVFRSIEYLLNKNGKLVIEFHYAKKILEDLQFDYIYHEHTYYFTLKTISYLAGIYGFYPNHVKKSQISGGSLILTLSRKKLKSNYLKKLEKKEIQDKTNSSLAIHNFNKRLNKFRKEILKLIKNSKYNFAGYGSSARSNTLINYVKLNNKHVDCIFDNNIMKHNMYAPGSKIKITKPTRNKIKQYKCIIVFAWNFYEEIKNELKLYGFKGKLIKTLPKIKVSSL